MSVLQSICQELKDQLGAQKAQVVQEIINYPPPIPACDAQFNYLLETRDRLSVEINRLNKLAGGQAEPDIAPDDLLQFMTASPFIDGEFTQTVRLRLGVLQPDQKSG